MNICFEDKKQKKYMKDNILMQEYEFGIQPVQIFNSKFPELKDKNKDKDKLKLFETIKEYNMTRFKKEHFIIKGDKEKCFICEGNNNIHKDYIKLFIQIMRKILKNF